MKNIYFSLILLVNMLVAFSQSPKLTYETHALLSGVNNPMTLCEYANPGSAGDNITWDFTNLKIATNFVGNLNSTFFKSTNMSANTDLEEFGTHFYFNVCEENMKQVGYASQDNKTIVTYTEPFKRMIFPFEYGTNYSTTFGGDYSYEGKKIGDISGKATIDGDAWGTLMLPGKTYKNTIRVKTEKIYTTTYQNSSANQVVITTYRWYNQAHRYPLLVLTEVKTITGDNPNYSYQAAYNSKALEADEKKMGSYSLNENVSVFPNPSETELNLQIYTPQDNQAQIIIFDLTGKKLIEKNSVEVTSGMNTISLSSDIQQLKPANYVVQIELANQVITRQVSIVND
jgi:hypothetical protein